MADEVDTDDELASKLKPPDEDGVAATVDTDDELRNAEATDGRRAWCLWGSYEPAKLKVRAARAL